MRPRRCRKCLLALLRGGLATSKTTKTLRDSSRSGPSDMSRWAWTCTCAAPG